MVGSEEDMAKTPAAEGHGGEGTDWLTNLSVTLGATGLGIIGVAALMYVLASRMGYGGGGILYVVWFIILAALGRKAVRAVLAYHAQMKWIVLAIFVAGVVIMELNYQRLGAEDPYLLLVILAIFVGVVHMFTAPKKAEK